MSTISGSVNHTVNLGSGGYTSSVTVAPVGSVLPPPAANGNVGSIGVDGNVAGGSLQNDGTIHGGTGGYNAGMGAGFIGGVGVQLTTGTVVTGGGGNAGSIVGGTGGLGYYTGGTGGAGVDLTAGAAILINNALIQGGSGGNGNALHNPSYDTYVYGSGGAGVDVSGGAQATNNFGGSIVGGTGASSNTNPAGAGGAGVYLNGGTFTNAGSIAGGAGGKHTGAPGAMGDAVTFGSVAGTLVIAPTASFTGQVEANRTVNDTLAVTGSSESPLTGLGTQFTGFSTLAFEPGAAIKVAVDTSQAVFNSQNLLTVSGMTSADILDVTNLTPTQAFKDFTPATNTLTANGVSIQFVGAGSNFIFRSDGTGTDISVGAACYRRGTRIRTTRGELPIETLGIGDHVVTAGGECRAVRWLGHRRIDCARHPEPAAVWPICIRAGAIADGQPARDLWVSPGHGIFIDGVLIQAEKLVNGASVLRIPCASVEYWHVELDRHDIVFAEGLAAESYLDSGNRAAFINGGDFVEAFPDFQPKHWTDTCVPLIQEGASLLSARARLLARCVELGHATEEHPLNHGFV